MSEAKQDGGPAFPALRKSWRDENGHYEHLTEDGMTLRDWFAGKAMQQIIGDERFVLGFDPAQVADRAYEYADAMLAARSA